MILYAPSYTSLIYYYYNYNIPDWKVITRNESIYEFCNKLEVEVFYFEIEKDFSRAGLIKYKNDIKNFVDKININGENILYCYYLCGIVDYYIIKKLSKNNLIYFNNLDPIFESPKASKLFKIEYLRKVQNKIIYFVFFGVYSKIYYGDNRFWLGIKKPIGSKIETKYNVKLKNNNIESINKKFNLKTYDYIYVDDIQAHLKSQISEVESILKMIEIKGYSVAIKLHPNEKSKLEGFEKLPKYLPAEFVYGFSKMGVIGVSSSSLKFLSQKVRTISLINFINNNRGDWKSNYTKFIIESDIILPQNKSELFKII